MSYVALEQHQKKLAQLEHLEAIAAWDEATMMSEGGGEARGEALATLRGIIHERAVSPAIGDWLAQAGSFGGGARTNGSGADSSAKIQPRPGVPGQRANPGGGALRGRGVRSPSGRKFQKNPEPGAWGPQGLPGQKKNPTGGRKPFRPPEIFEKKGLIPFPKTPRKNSRQGLFSPKKGVWGLSEPLKNGVFF